MKILRRERHHYRIIPNNLCKQPCVREDEHGLFIVCAVYDFLNNVVINLKYFFWFMV